MRRAVWVTVTTVAACGMVGSGCNRDQQKTVNVIGSTSIQSFADLLNEAYRKKNPGHKVEVQGGGSTAGIKAATDGLADIGMSSRSLTPEEAGRFQEIIIARDGLAIVVHPSNPVKGLTTEQARRIFAGAATNWKDVGGKDATIRLVSREEGSGTRESFTHLVMGNESITRSALVQESNGAVKALVKGNADAIGYMSLGLVGDELKALRVDDQEPTAAAVVEGKYKLARPFLFVTKGVPNPEAQAFIDFVLSEEGQKLLESKGLIRAK